jgi:hypothetical protein
MAEMQGSYEQFLRRYEDLKALYFSPKSNPQYDDDGEELPSSYMSKVQITKIFLEEMRVQVPSHRQDPPRFLDGRVGPSMAEIAAMKATPVAPQPTEFSQADLDAVKQELTPPAPEVSV